MNPEQLLQHFDRLSETPDAIPRLRRFILDLAVRGKLVEQDPNDEPASELIKRIRAEREKLGLTPRHKDAKKSKKADEENLDGLAVVPSFRQGLPESSTQGCEILAVKEKLGLTPRRKDAKKSDKADEKNLGDLAAWREMPFAIPVGWEWLKLGELCKKTGSGSTPSGGQTAYTKSGIPFLRSQNIYDDGLRLDGVAYIPDVIHQQMIGTAVCPGDLLLNITGGSIGRCALVPDSFALGNINQHVAIIRLAVVESNKYIHCIIVSTYFQSQIFRSQTGAGREGLPKNKMDEINIPLPPFAEQHRIVAKVDELMALCDQLEEAKTEREQSRDRLVAASLQRLNDLGQNRHSGRDCRNPEHREVNAGAGSESISTGQLDRGNPCLNDGDKLNSTGMDASLNLGIALPGDWIPAIPAGMTDGESIAFFLNHLPRITTRPAHIKQLRQTILNLAVRGKLVAQDPNDEPAAELIKRIWAEKVILVHEGKLNKAKPLPRIAHESIKHELPLGWGWVRLGDLSYLVTSGSRDWARFYSDDGAIFLRMGNLSRGSYQLRLDNIQRVKPPQDGEGARTKLEVGDILISITGEVGLLGLIPSGFDEAYINQHTCLVRPSPVLNNRYLPEMFRSPFAQDQFNEPQRGIKNSFRLTDVTEFIVPLPPLAEQHRIVAKVDELMALCDQLEAQLTATEADSRRLLESVLHETLSPALAEAA